MAGKNSNFPGSTHTIVIKIAEKNYQRFIKEIRYSKGIIDKTLHKYPELFPSDILDVGYIFNGLTRKSKKMYIQMRKIKIGEATYQVQPSFVLPFMRGKTNEVENALFLLRFSVPFWALAYIWEGPHVLVSFIYQFWAKQLGWHNNKKGRNLTCPYIGR